MEVFLRMGSALDIAAVRKKPREWIPGGCWGGWGCEGEGRDSTRTQGKTETEDMGRIRLCVCVCVL